MTFRNLKLVDKEIPKDTILGRLHSVDDLVTQLVDTNKALREELDDLCEAIGLSRLDYAYWRTTGQLRVHVNATALSDLLDSVKGKLEEALKE